MLSFLKPRDPADAVETTYYRMHVRAARRLHRFIGYAGYYFVCSNFTLSTPYLRQR